MKAELERIKADALKLSVEERERLIETLIDSLDRSDATTTGEFGGFASAEIQKSWMDEVERRIQRIRDGESKLLPVDEVMAIVRAGLKASLDSDAAGGDCTPALVTPELELAWAEESHRRMKLIESGEMETYPADEVIARLRADLRR